MSAAFVGAMREGVAANPISSRSGGGERAQA